jgi:hypothetical protein
VQAVAGQYAEAHASLTQALRKAPAAAGAGAFRARALCASVVVQLLLGDIPARSTFAAAEPGVPRAALAPYYDVTRAVRGGNLAGFDAALRAHAAAFDADGVRALVGRLQSAVIRAGLHAISSAYSRIATADVAAKLSLPAAADAEVLCAKAIRDGLVDGELAVAADGSAGVFSSREGANAYRTREPQEALHKRIRFCLDVHAEAIRVRAPRAARRRRVPGCATARVVCARRPLPVCSLTSSLAPSLPRSLASFAPLSLSLSLSFSLARPPSRCAGDALPAARAQGGLTVGGGARRARKGGERVGQGDRGGRRRRGRRRRLR